MATPSEEMNKDLTWRRFEEGENQWDDWGEKIFKEDTSHKCPTYVHKTPPCQGSCPSGGFSMPRPIPSQPRMSSPEGQLP